MLNDQEKSLIRSLVQDPRWQVVIRLSEKYAHMVKSIPPLSDTQWKTVANVLVTEGKVMGVQEFLQDVINQAS